jgi:hypothetical protein
MVITTASFILQAIALDGYATTSYDRYWLIAHATVLLIFVSTAFFLTFDHTDIRVHAAQHVKLFCRYCKDIWLSPTCIRSLTLPFGSDAAGYTLLPRIDTCHR